LIHCGESIAGSAVDIQEADQFPRMPPTFIWVVQAHILDDAHKGSSMA